MSGSRVERIMTAMLTALTAPTMTAVPAASVFRDLDSALDSELPAIVIEEGGEPAPDLSVIQRAGRHLNVRVAVLIKGTLPFSLADAALIESFDRIMADRTLAGLAMNIEEGETKRERAMLEKPVAIVTKDFIVHFRTDETSLL